MPRGSKDQYEMAARMRDAGYDEHEIREELEEAEWLTRELAKETELFKRTGAFSPPDPPILRENANIMFGQPAILPIVEVNASNTLTSSADMRSIDNLHPLIASIGNAHEQEQPIETTITLPATYDEIERALRTSGVYVDERSELYISVVNENTTGDIAFNQRALFSNLDITKLSDINLLAKQMVLNPKATSDVKHALDILGTQMNSIEEMLHALARAASTDLETTVPNENTSDIKELREAINAKWDIADSYETSISETYPEDLKGYTDLLESLREGRAFVNLETGEVLSVYPNDIPVLAGQPIVATGDPQYISKLIVNAQDMARWAQEQVGRHNIKEGIPTDAIENLEMKWLQDGTSELKEVAESKLGPDGMSALANERIDSEAILAACQEARDERIARAEAALSPKEESERLRSITDSMLATNRKAKERQAQSI